jgi:hypothetical protein
LLNGLRNVQNYQRTFAGRYRPEVEAKGIAFDKFAHLFHHFYNNNDISGNKGQLEREFYKHIFEACRWHGDDRDMAAAAAAWYRLKRGV